VDIERLGRMDRIPITRAGLEKLKEELSHVERVDRPANIRAIEEARGHGDLSENAEYHAAKERQSFIDGRINELRAVIGKAEVIAVDAGPTDRVVFGRTVRLFDIQTQRKAKFL
jgi:transcription elongation factor GreA